MEELRPTSFVLKVSKPKRVPALSTIDKVPDDEKVLVRSIEGSNLKNLSGDDAPKVLVIPLPKPIPFSRREPSAEQVPSGAASATSIEEQAVLEIIADTKDLDSLNSIPVLPPVPHESSPRIVQGVPVPLLAKNLAPELLKMQSDDERFRYDISQRPDDISVKSEAYEAVPVDQFGAAMLRGMGWTGPSEDDEKFARKYTESIVPRERGLGLGAMARPPGPEVGDRSSKAQRGDNNRGEWKRKGDDKLLKQQISVGSLVWLRDPLFAGRRACIVATRGVPGLDRIRVCLEADGTILDVKRLDAVLLSEEELLVTPYKGKITSASSQQDAEPDLRNDEAEKGLGSSNRTDLEHSDRHFSKHKKDKEKRRDGDCMSANISMERHKKQKKEETVLRKDRKKPQSAEKWLLSGIRVRIISRKPGGESIYLQKGGVLDVYGDYFASVQLDNGSVIDSLKQKHLETVLPHTGGSVRVLLGPHRGQEATLLEKQSESETCVVQLCEDLNVIVLSMDAVAAVWD